MATITMAPSPEEQALDLQATKGLHFIQAGLFGIVVSVLALFMLYPQPLFTEEWKMVAVGTPTPSLFVLAHGAIQRFFTVPFRRARLRRSKSPH